MGLFLESYRWSWRRSWWSNFETSAFDRSTPFRLCSTQFALERIQCAVTFQSEYTQLSPFWIGYDISLDSIQKKSLNRLRAQSRKKPKENWLSLIEVCIFWSKNKIILLPATAAMFVPERDRNFVYVLNWQISDEHHKGFNGVDVTDWSLLAVKLMTKARRKMSWLCSVILEFSKMENSTNAADQSSAEFFKHWGLIIRARKDIFFFFLIVKVSYQHQPKWAGTKKRPSQPHHNNGSNSIENRNHKISLEHLKPEAPTKQYHIEGMHVIYAMIQTENNICLLFSGNINTSIHGMRFRNDEDDPIYRWIFPEKREFIPQVFENEKWSEFLWSSRETARGDSNVSEHIFCRKW